MQTTKEFDRDKALPVLLRDNFSPVARMRLYSRGVQTNNRLAHHETPTADKGCLACGCCIDNCPVVREKLRQEFRQNRRTSMSLENIVGDDCRRCYRCVRSCPQVSKETKEFVWGYRRKEKFVHAAMATAIFTLMATGIFLYHYREHIPEWQGSFLGFVHLLAGLLLLAVPVLFWLLDRETFKDTLRKAWACYSPEDKAWWKDFGEFLRHPVGKALPHWREFNPYHKFWICYLSVAVPVLVVTGIINYCSPTTPGEGFYAFIYAVHSLVALCTDLLVLTHLYFKLVRFLIRVCADMYKSWRATGSFHYPFLYDNNRNL